MGERALRGLYRGRKPLAFRSAKKNLFCTMVTFYPDRHSTFQTKQVVFTGRDAAQPTSKNSEGCAKRERRHAPHASHRAQARRTRPSSSLSKSVSHGLLVRTPRHLSGGFDLFSPSHFVIHEKTA